jgi:copper resistance protein C
VKRAIVLWTVGCVTAGMLAWTGAALGHAKLLRAEPAAGSTVKAAPRVVRATFNDELDPRRSTMTVTDARTRRVDDGKGGVDLDDLDRKTMIARLRAVGPGTYTVHWKAVSADDQNVAQGTFRFTVAR